MKRVLVIGSGGAGKSTFAKRLGARLGIEVIHLDAYYWNPGWIETPKPQWKDIVATLIEKDAWIMDGNYSGTLEPRLEACDTIIFLDLPRLLCLWRVMKRVLKYRGTHRPDMAEGCTERFDWIFTKWIWSYPNRTRLEIIGLLEKHGAGKQVIRLRSRREVESFLSQLQSAGQLIR